MIYKVECTCNEPHISGMSADESGGYLKISLCQECLAWLRDKLTALIAKGVSPGGLKVNLDV